MKREQEKKREEDKQRLLIDWSEDENEEAEEYRKIQVSPSTKTETKRV